MKLLEPFFSAYSSIFSLHSKVLGLFLALTTLLQPNIGIAGFMGLFWAAIYLRLFNIPFNSYAAKTSLINSLLVGLLIGDLLALNFWVALLLMIFVSLTFLLTGAIRTIFAEKNLPCLALPFCIVALMIFILLPNFYKFSHPPVILEMFDITQFLPDFLVYFFHSISSLLCITNPNIGILFWSGILLTSPFAALFLLLGFTIGSTTESLLHEVSHNLFFYSEGYNYALVFTALAGFFLAPSLFSILLATLATVVTAIVVVVSGAIFNPWHLPILSLPFNLVLLMVLLALKNLKPQVLNIEFFDSPELNLETSRLSRLRHRYPEIGIFLPVKGTWKIQQAFNGDLTHRGLWSHALDFVATNNKAEIFSNKGLDLDDYFSFGKEIFSPVDGYVIDLVSENEDNNIGQVVNGKNWGNYLIIKTIYDSYVTLSHLKKDSISVTIGSFVKVGQKLAECGNSGYSQEPHLHLQVSHQPKIGSPTTAFHLVNYAVGDKIYFHRTPLVNEVVQHLEFNRAAKKILNFKIDEVIFFEKNNKEIAITNKLDEASGRFYLSDGNAKLFYAEIGQQFYFYGLKAKKYSALCDLMFAAPRIPATYGKEFEYHDYLPLTLICKAPTRFYYYLLHVCGFKNENLKAKYQINKQGFEIKGQSKTQNSFLKIDPASGIQEFSVGNRKYVRFDKP